jgi:Holliday junction resolvase-like predicted endonuclease
MWIHSPVGEELSKSLLYYEITILKVFKFISPSPLKAYSPQLLLMQGERFGFLHALLETYQKQLYLFFEYEDPPPDPPHFLNSLDLLESKQNLRDNNTPNSLSIPRSEVLKRKHFHPEDIIRMKNGEYYSVILEQRFSNPFDCIMKLQERFNLEDILTAFTWQDFEQFIAATLHDAGYFSLRTFRFTTAKKRHEVDIIAREGYRLLFIDAKHWNTKTASSSALMRVAQEQIIRAQHLIKNPDALGHLLRELQFPPKAKFQPIVIYPIILISSQIAHPMIINGVPVLSIMQWKEFLSNFSALESNLEPIKATKAAFQSQLPVKIKRGEKRDYK